MNLTASEPALAGLLVTPTSLHFDSQPIGTTSAPQTLTVTNAGSSLLIVGLPYPALIGPGATEFEVVSSTDPLSSLAPGSNLLLEPTAICLVTVRFRPKTAGAKTARLRLITSDSETTTEVPVTGGTPELAQLEISASADLYTAQPGQSITYRLDYHNDGPGAASNVVLTDTLPSGLLFKQATGSGSLSGNVVTWKLRTLAAGGGGTQRLTVQVAMDVPGGAILASTSQIAADEAPRPVSQQLTVKVVQLPQLQVSKSADRDSARPGDFITYSLFVSNVGSGPATGVTIRDNVPLNTLLAQIFEGGARQGNVVAWDVETVNPGVPVTVHFRVQVQASAASAGAVTNVAQVRSNELPDGVASNTATTTIKAPPQLSLLMRADREMAARGQMVTYTLTASNAGPGTATDVQIRDKLPASTTYVGAPGGRFDGDSVNWSLGTLLAGASQSRTLQVRVNDDASATITNTAAVTAQEVPDTFFSNSVETGVSFAGTWLKTTSAAASWVSLELIPVGRTKATSDRRSWRSDSLLG